MPSTSKLVLWVFPAIPLVFMGGAWLLTPASHPVERTASPAQIQTPMEQSGPTAVEPIEVPLPERPKVNETPSVFFDDGFGKSRHLHGHLWFVADEAGSTIKGECGPSDCMRGATQEVCATGRVKAVEHEDWEGTWGAAMGWNIAQAFGTSRVGELGDVQVKGLSFNFRDQSPNLGPIRFGVRTDETEYCVNMKNGRNEIRWTDLRKNCWDPGEAEVTPESSTISAIKWHVVALPSQSRDFDICVSDLQELND